MMQTCQVGNRTFARHPSSVFCQGVSAGKSGEGIPRYEVPAFGQGLSCFTGTAALTNAALQHGPRNGSAYSLSRFLIRVPCCKPNWIVSAGLQQMNELLGSYLPIVIFIGVALLVGVALIVAPFLVAYRNPDPEKLSAYECGFNSFDVARMKFDVRFYLVSILFIIFDLEVAFLFPWAVSFGEIGMLG